MKLIVGLGNPGKKYDGTRHNVGFRVISELHERFGSPRSSSKFDSELVQVQVSSVDEKVILQSPLTFMNASGKAVRGVFDFYKLKAEDILVICDDLNLDVGRLRFRPKGSPGGQNGLKDIIQKLGTPEFSRLRLGIGRPPAGWDVSGYVLGKFDEEDGASIDKAVKRAADSVLVWLDQGTSVCMNRYNADPSKPKQPKKPKPQTAPKSEAQGDKSETIIE